MAEDPTLWENRERAQILLRERTHLEKSIKRIHDIEKELAESIELIVLGESENDTDIIVDAENVILALGPLADKMGLESLLSGEADTNDCYIEINAGAGGTESQDWAQMLVRMYVRWAESHGCRIEWIEESPGEEAGIKSSTFKVEGINSYGWLKTEAGVHRLVRISPFDSQSRRHTSFASVWVYPVIDDSIKVEIADKDLRIDTYRASGAGGQHVNKTDSAVRLTHLLTGIVVQCQNDRSQHRNRATAMNMMRARLYEHELQKREAEAQVEQDAKTEIGWGHQIRSYVLHPYQMVKDHRTKYETSNIDNILDGNLNEFIRKYLLFNMESK